MTQLDLRKVAHFITVVEERTMTGAARRLQLSQQALSMSIRALERDLGVVLLHRDRRGVALLPAGRQLYADGVQLLAAATTAAERARQADGSTGALLRIGHTPSVTGVEVTEVLAAAEAAPDGVTIQVIQVPPTDLSDRLWDRSIDLGLRRSLSPASGLAGHVVARHRLRVAVRREHPLAQREVLTLRDIAAETLVVPAPGDSPDADLLLAICRDAGVEPRHRVDPVQGTPPVTAVLGNDDVALVTDAPGSAVGGAVRVVELEPATTLPLLATWRRDSRCPARDAVVQALAG